MSLMCVIYDHREAATGKLRLHSDKSITHNALATKLQDGSLYGHYLRVKPEHCHPYMYEYTNVICVQFPAQ